MSRSFPRTRATYRLLYDAAQTWINDRALRLAAGVAYYALFALVPVLFLSVSFASFFLGQAVRVDVEEALADFIGQDLAAALIDVIDSIELGGSRTVVSLFGLGVLLFTATLLFVAFKEVVDLLWGIPRERGLRASLSRRLFGLAAVLGSGVLLTLNLAVESIIGFVDQFLDSQLLDALVKIAGSFVVVGLGALFIAILFKYTPAVDITWRSVWFAAMVTMALLAVGTWGYGVYLKYYGFSSAAGVAGTLLLGLALVYYAAAILLYGIEIVRLAHSSDEFVPLSFRKWVPTSG